MVSSGTQVRVMQSDTHSTGYKHQWQWLLLPMLVLCLATPGYAAESRVDLPDLARPPASNGFAPAPGISLEKATAIARKHTGGRVLSATPKQRSNGTVYRIRMLVDGERVVTVTVDERGQIRDKK